MKKSLYCEIMLTIQDEYANRFITNKTILQCGLLPLRNAHTEPKTGNPTTISQYHHKSVLKIEGIFGFILYKKIFKKMSKIVLSIY